MTIPLEQVIAQMSIRGVGHTRAMLYGIEKLPQVFVMVQHRSMARVVEDVNKNAVIFTPDSSPSVLMGHNSCPIVVDHFAMTTMLERYREESNQTIRQLHIRIRELGGVI